MRNASDLKRGKRRGARNGGLALVMLAGSIILGAEGIAAQGVPQTPASTSAGASHDIVMRLSVPASCRMTAHAAQIRLSGATADGTPVDTTLSGQGGFVVDCNTPYSMSLARSTVYAAEAPAARRQFRASVDREQVPVARAAANGAASGFSTSGANEAAFDLVGDMDVMVRVDGRGGVMEQNCVMAQTTGTPFVCHAFAGPDDARLPPPRATASLIVTGTLDRAGSASAPVTMFHEAAGAAFGLVQPSPGGVNAMAESDVAEAAALRLVRDQAIGGGSGRRIGDLLTVSLTARY